VVPDPEHKPVSDDRADRLKSLRKKLSKLNRQAMPDTPPAASREGGASLARHGQTGTGVPPAAPRKRDPGTILYARDLPREKPRRVRGGGGICLPLERCLDGCEAPSAVGPPFYLIERSLAEAEEEPDGHTLPALLADSLDTLARREAVDGQPPPPVAPEQVCFLDLETTGLGSCPVFLIGTLVCRDGQMFCRQFLARTYAEELSIVHAYAQQVGESTMLVTFNGKTFDVPFLRTRAAATGVTLPEPTEHFDLLHAARRAFRNRLPDCKLQTLERYVCGRHRGDDIPGSDIPAAYHDFVHSGDARQIALIAKHNQWDLVTMVHLMAKIMRDA